MSRYKPADQQTIELLSGHWCNQSAPMTAVMESVSYVTPMLEYFFMRTVAEAVPQLDQQGELHEQCLTFIREEASHSRDHRQFNIGLDAYLGRTPPGLAMVEWILKRMGKVFSLPQRLLFAAALEHFAAVMSKVYVEHEHELDMQSRYAREMFAMHANEELGHCSVVYDLWQHHANSGALGKSLVVGSILFVVALYFLISVPWILYRKSNRSFSGTLSNLGSFIWQGARRLPQLFPLSEFFSFVRKNYHPSHLIA